MKRSRSFFFFLAMLAALSAEEEPWFTGTLLAPFTEAIPKGEIDALFYFYNSFETARYDSHWKAHSEPHFYTLSPVAYFFYGLTDRWTFSIFPGFDVNHTQGKTGVGVEDLPVAVGYQLWKRKKWLPGLLITVTETFPIGKYQKLKPRLHGADQTGDGVFLTSIDLTFYNMYHLGGVHYITPYLDIEFDIAAPLDVKGFNAYGGGYGTKGRVNPGNFFLVYTGGELSLTRHWVFALDIEYAHRNATHFSGKKGVDSSGVAAETGEPSMEQLSLAPALEYNFSENFGIVAGVWFTVMGRNSEKFARGILNFACSF